MKLAISLQTTDGFKLYKNIEASFILAKKTNSLNEFKSELWTQLSDAERELLHFLNDEHEIKTHKMDDNDPEGWKFWKVASDTYTVMNYFYKKQA